VTVMTHPSSMALEAFACGEASASVAEHLDTCAECSGFVEKARELLDTEAPDDAEGAVARALAALPSPPPSHEADVVSLAAARSPSRAASPRDVTRARARTSSSWSTLAWAAVPIAAAAVFLLLLSRDHGGPPHDPGALRATAPPAAPSAPERVASLDPPGAEPDVTFKGGLQATVVRDRSGSQARFAGTVQVRPGDRLRLEVALDREQAILGAVLDDDGSFLELMPDTVRGPGTHFSERSARIDARPTRGTILIGSPAAVAHARATRRFEGVLTVRVEPEVTP